MSTENEKNAITIANLPAPDEKARGTMSAEELAKIMSRARAETADKVVTVGEERRDREEQEAADREVFERAQLEQGQVRVIDADTAARRGQANMTVVRSGCVVGGTTIAGFLIGGPLGAVIGCAAGWIGNRFFGGE